jgi:Uma2 family endonuclease
MLNNCWAPESEVSLNAPAPHPSGTMDIDEFTAFLETRPDEEHWELIEGVAVMVAPASYAHQRIVRNLCELLNDARLFAYFDAGVRSPGVRNFQPQPDVVVVPGVAGYNLYSERFRGLVADQPAPGD